MSASSPVITIEVGDKREQVNVRASLRRLYSRRALWRAAAGITKALACALAALCLVALADYRWPQTLPVRVALLLLILLTTLFFVARSLWAWLRARTLTEVAREIEQAAGSSRNALVTFSENLEGVSTQAKESYMLARLERQAWTELAQLDEKLVAPREGAVRGACALLFLLLLIFAVRVATPLVFARELGRVLWLANNDALLTQLNVGVAESAGQADTEIFVEELRVRVLPPAYAGLSAEEVSGDAPLRVLAGSQVEVVVHTAGEVQGATLAFNGSTNAMRSLGAGRFSGSFTAKASGAFE